MSFPRSLLARLAGLGLAVVSSLELAGGAELVDLARAAKPSVVQLLIYDRAGEVRSSGTGFFIDGTGRMVTNWHVVEGASKVEAEMADGRKVPVAGLLAEDKANDIAVIQCNFQPPAGSWLELIPAGGKGVEPGQRIFVIGAPRGMSGTVSEGIVSAIRSAKDLQKFWREGNTQRTDLIQITAPVSHGSSGSPVLDANGKVLGVAVAILGGGQNLNFAVPVAIVHQLLTGLPETPKPRGFSVFSASPPNALRNLAISCGILAVIGFAFRYVVGIRPSPGGGRRKPTNRA